MLTQQVANEMITKAKEASRREILTWFEHSRNDETVIAVGEPHSQFMLSVTRNPFEVKAHFRTKSTNVHLARIDTQAQHINPDGQRVLGPHLHLYREGFANLEWAEPIDWYEPHKPLKTLLFFLDIVHTRFPFGIQEALL